MTRLAVSAAMLATMFTTSAASAFAASPDDVQAVADAAGVDSTDLAGALNTTGLDAHAYLCMADGIGCPPPVQVPVVSNSRVKCIENRESGGANIANRQGSGAVGVMQYKPSTFAAHAREMGHNNWSPWNPAQAEAVAAHDLAMGRRGQWTVGGC